MYVVCHTLRYSSLGNCGNPPKKSIPWRIKSIPEHWWAVLKVTTKVLEFWGHWNADLSAPRDLLELMQGGTGISIEPLMLGCRRQIQENHPGKTSYLIHGFPVVSSWWMLSETVQPSYTCHEAVASRACWACFPDGLRISDKSKLLNNVALRNHPCISYADLRQKPVATSKLIWSGPLLRVLYLCGPATICGGLRRVLFDFLFRSRLYSHVFPRQTKKLRKQLGLKILGLSQAKNPGKNDTPMPLQKKRVTPTPWGVLLSNFHPFHHLEDHPI